MIWRHDLIGVLIYSYDVIFVFVIVCLADMVNTGVSLMVAADVVQSEVNMIHISDMTQNT